MASESLLLVAQGLLCLVFSMAGGMKVFAPEKVRKDMPWARPGEFWSDWVGFIGRLEVLGAIGIIAPTLIGVHQWIAPVAAVGFASIMVLALTTVNIPGRTPGIVVDSIVLALALYVINGRWALLAPILAGKLPF